MTQALPLVRMVTRNSLNKYELGEKYGEKAAGNLVECAGGWGYKVRLLFEIYCFHGQATTNFISLRKRRCL